MRTAFAISFFFATLAFCGAQDTGSQTPPAPGQQQITPMDDTPRFKVSVVERTTRAINYRHRAGATTVGFRGTELMPKANGEAKVESKQGYIEVEVEFDDLEPPSRFGKEILTYVLWAVTPQGRAVNLGEVILNGNRSKLNVTSELQAFGMIVTAEPYYAVTQPSNLVVLENFIRPDTVGAQEMINAKYELIERGGYVPTGADFTPVTFNKNLPREFYQAQNAMRIAQLAKADQYASSSWGRARQLYQQAEEYSLRKNIQRGPITSVSREAVQTFEEARLISLRRQDEERLAQERAAASEREAAARRQAEEEAARRAEAESQAQREARQREEAEQQRLEAQRIAEERARQAEEQRRQAEDAARLRQEAEAAREAEARQRQQAEADRLRAEQAARQAEQQRLQAEREKEEMRARLLQQLNAVLETRDTQRGLIVNMSDVLFDTGKATLRPGAREKLAKISGIILAYPGLKLEIEGHTDSVGSDEYNERLSEKRALAVRSYLTRQGVPEDVMTALGLGESQPVATNRTAAGRQLNRRVEMVVSGEVIGTQVGRRQGVPPQGAGDADVNALPQSSEPPKQDPPRPKL